ncbi:hypothetical protein [Blastococcus sp. Marseille-P5729]|uniref:hypothetical protein n=1 Tax=Blastococcus sp. Marseille-P5729 TaxID=2086582 RepID=UPI00131BC882|nr:hypothetical protein [Blastococcus sp. Marseille-P5729]
MTTRVARRSARSDRPSRHRRWTPPGRPPRRRNRRRGAPRSALVRRLLALALLACAGLLAVRDHQRPAAEAAPAADAVQPAADPMIPLVLPVADATTVTVLEEGKLVDVYAAYDEQPPTLMLEGVRLIDVRATEDAGPAAQPPPAHIVIGITVNQRELVEDLLAARLIIATVSAVQFDTSSR